jgi:hypothetical protein
MTARLQEFERAVGKPAPVAVMRVVELEEDRRVVVLPAETRGGTSELNGTGFVVVLGATVGNSRVAWRLRFPLSYHAQVSSATTTSVTGSRESLRTTASQVPVGAESCE